MYRSRMEQDGTCLQDLAALAIGTPEVGAVNFTALHTLLHAIIKHLQIQDVKVQLPCGTRQHPSSGQILVRKEQNGHVDRLERRILHMEKQLEALNTLPSGFDLIERSKSKQEGGGSAVEDMWQIMQLKKRLEVNEEGVSKAMAVLQDLMLEINTIKGSQRGIEDQIQNMTITAAMVAKQTLEQKQSDGIKQLEKERLEEELESLKTQIMELEETFKVFRETLARCPGTKLSDKDNSHIYDPIQGTSHRDGPILTTSQTMPSRTQGSSQAEISTLLVETSHGAQDGMTATTLKDTPIEVLGQHHEGDLTSAHPVAPVPHSTEINPTVTGMDGTAAPGSPGATSQDYAMLHTRVDALERDKADRSELGLIQKNTDELAMTLQDIQEKLSNLSGELQDMRGDATKLDELQRRNDPTGTLQKSGQTLEDTGLRTTIQEIENELKELRKRPELEKSIIEQSVGEKALNLQDQDGKRFAHIQKTMKQLQEECERLGRTTGSLIQDREQKQQHIDVLYQTVANLDKNKVDKDPIGLQIDVTADKHMLERKVSRTQFDASTEHLSRMIQELLGKVSAQEQDWQRLLEKINVEMQTKLDRIELEPMKNILEQCWRDLRRQLQEHPPQYEADEAAGIRKQLIQRFHCISCNRMVDMVVPGPEMLTIPNIPGLPARVSNRPYSVFELDQVRQQSRSDRLPPLTDFGYTSSSRNCGGSHTLTFPQRRYSRLQASTPCTMEKEDFMGNLKGEVFILGQDGHIYRGRRDKHLPTLETKDGKRTTVVHQKLCDCNLKGE